MKKLTLLLCLLVASSVAFGQIETKHRFESPNTESTNKERLTTTIPYFYIGPGNGFNTYTGLLGGIAEVPIVPHFSAFVGAGIGGWGHKVGGGFLFYVKEEYIGSALGIGYSHAFGVNYLTTELSLYGSDQTRPVVMNLYDAPTLNFTYQYHIRIGHRVKCVLGTGFAMATVDQPYEVITPKNAQLSDSSKLVMQLLQPGGLMFSVAFQFGVGRR